MFRKKIILFCMTAGLCSAAYGDAPSTGGKLAFSDKAVQKRVRSQLHADPCLKASKFKITTVNGDVTLSGSIASEDAKAVAELLTGSIDGVESVDNQLNVVAATDVNHSSVCETERKSFEARKQG